MSENKDKTEVGVYGKTRDLVMSSCDITSEEFDEVLDAWLHEMQKELMMKGFVSESLKSRL